MNTPDLRAILQAGQSACERLERDLAITERQAIEVESDASRTQEWRSGEVRRLRAAAQTEAGKWIGAEGIRDRMEAALRTADEYDVQWALRSARFTGPRKPDSDDSVEFSAGLYWHAEAKSMDQRELLIGMRDAAAGPIPELATLRVLSRELARRSPSLEVAREAEAIMAKVPLPELSAAKAIITEIQRTLSTLDASFARLGGRNPGRPRLRAA